MLAKLNPHACIMAATREEIATYAYVLQNGTRCKCFVLGVGGDFQGDCGGIGAVGEEECWEKKEGFQENAGQHVGG